MLKLFPVFLNVSDPVTATLPTVCIETEIEVFEGQAPMLSCLGDPEGPTEQVTFTVHSVGVPYVPTAPFDPPGTRVGRFSFGGEVYLVYRD